MSKNMNLAVLLMTIVFWSPLKASQVLVVGDSWAERIVPALRTVFEKHGHADVTVERTEFWGLAARLSSAEGLEFIAEELAQRPDIDIVHLSIGHNDVHCLLVNGQCTFNWNPSMAGTAAEDEILDTIIADTETIVDYILSIRPEVTIFIQSYDYMRPRDNIPQRGTPIENNAVHTKWADRVTELAGRKPKLTFLNLMGLMQSTYGFDGIAYTPYDPPTPIPAGDPSLPDPTLPSPSEAFQSITHLTTQAYQVFAEGQYEGFYGAALDDDGFRINAGLNDAWFNPATNGQGFLISVFPEIRQMFLAWFTYDVQRPPEDVTAMLGEPGHRWLTAQGPYEGDTANLTVYVTEGGVFDAAEPEAITDLTGDGSMTIEFADCSEGLVTYQITSLDISGEIPIQRIVPDNLPLCESLGAQ
jgi:hypothetical protein